MTAILMRKRKRHPRANLRWRVLAAKHLPETGSPSCGAAFETFERPDVGHLGGERGKVNAGAGGSEGADIIGVDGAVEAF